ncbi:MAG: hypothetical protein KGN32_14500 [Burkholderiales bacterium]|nr:hypothetical protein [Burkholderiales bacterium]
MKNHLQTPENCTQTGPIGLLPRQIHEIALTREVELGFGANISAAC